MMTVYCSTSHLLPTGIVGSVEQIRDILCGPQDHNEHMRGYRWFLYTRDANRRSSERDAILIAEVRKMAVARRERLEMLRREIRGLEAAE